MATYLHLIGVSAGDATLIQHIDGKKAYHILIDGGLDKETTHQYLLDHDICQLDLVVASHLDYDHIKGLLAIFEDTSIHIGQFWTFDIFILQTFLETGTIPSVQQSKPRYLLNLIVGYDIRQQCEVRGIPCKQVAAGYMARFGGLVFEVLYPTQLYLDYLYTPGSLKIILEKRAIPLDWKIGKHRYAPERDIRGKTRRSRRLKFPKDSQLNTLVDDMRPKYREWTQSDDTAQEVLAGSMGQEDYQPPHYQEFDVEPGPGPGPWEICDDRTIMNDLSAVIRISAVRRNGARSVLFTGDLENWTPLILTNAFKLESDLLKVPHHGSQHVGWSPEQASCFLEARLHRIKPPIWPFFSPVFLPYLFYSRHFSSDMGDILDLVQPEKALLFPFPFHHLPNQSVIDMLHKRNIGLIANRRNPAGQEWASREMTPETQIIRLDP